MMMMSEPVQVITPTDTMAARAPRVRRIRPVESPASPLVQQLMEMGFVRKNVEFAIKAISKYCHIDGFGV